MSDYNDQDIDIRPYIRAVLSRWYWILGLGLLAGVLAYSASLLLRSPVYEATALVTFSTVQQRVEFDRRIVTVEENPILSAYPEIAMSDELLEAVRDELPAATPFTLQQLRSTLRANQGTDPHILRLTVTNSDPELASDVANVWAEHLVTWANKIAGESSEQQLLFFEQRLEEAAVSLKAAEEAIVEHQAQNQSIILQNELASLQATHAELLAKEEEIEQLLRDIDSLLAISQDDRLDDSAAGDQFTVLILRLRTFGGPTSAENVDFSWQLQANSGDDMVETGRSLEDQVLILRAVLEVQAEQTVIALAEIEPQLLSVQRERQEARAVDLVLTRNLDLASDTHTALAQTIEEKRIKSQEDYSGASLASRSSPPTSAVGSRNLLNTVAAIAGAAFLSVLIIILHTWWRFDE